MIFGRTPPLPGPLAAVVPLDPGERVLAWAPRLGGGAVVPTLDHLVVVAVDGSCERHPWTDVERAAWEPESRTFAVWWAGRAVPTALELGEPGRVPRVLAERVQASIAAVRTVALPDGATARVVLRRTRDGRFSVQVPRAPGVDRRDARVAAALDAAGRELLADVGR